MNGKPVEITDDAAGDIWYLGEYVTNYENGKVVDHAGSSEAARSRSRFPSSISTPTSRMWADC